MCHKLRHIFSSTLARNLLQLEHLCVTNCRELKQIIAEDDDEAHDISLKNHLHPGHFPKLVSLHVRQCNKLKCLFHVNISRGLQKLRELYIIENLQLEEVFAHKDGEDVMDDKEIVMDDLWHLAISELPSLTYFCPVGYHFIFPSLDICLVKRCPKMRTRFSAGQDDSIFAEAEEPQFGEEDVPPNIEEKMKDKKERGELEHATHSLTLGNGF